MFFKDFRTFETTLAGRPLVVEVGKMAQLAGGSCLIRYGETEVLCTATMADKPREGVDFFPLSVDFEEKLYAVGRIPGSFQRREGKASEKATLASRVIDRPIRPLFPKDMRNDVGVVATVMSVDPDCSPEITAMIGVSVAISISAIPWDGPISGVSVGLVNGEYVINPTEAQREVSEMAVTVASTKDLVAMIEAGANEVSNDDMFDGIMYAHKVNQEIVKFIEDITAEVGKEKIAFESNDPAPEMFEAIKEFAIEDVKVALDTDDKRIRDDRLKPIYDAVHEKFDEVYPEEIAKIDDCMYKLQKYIVRRWLLDDGKRVDGRGINDMRPLDAQIDLLSRVHGSGMFTRGQTQVLTIATLAPLSEAQKLDGIGLEETKRYMHQYNFPS
ncbi:MAG: polyribonucleotide nucleotidyltransferase, partial [Clostridia bacterium]|nr:polyribonucleotide nucleotidyltransferase [Clostridia bacterium]